MESRDKLSVLPGCHDMSVYFGKHFNPVVYHFYIRSTEEGHGYLADNALKGCFDVETAQLPTVGIAAHEGVHRRNAFRLLPLHFFGEQYQAGTSAENRQPLGDGLPDRYKQSEVVQQLAHGCRLPSGNDETVFRLVPIAQLANLKDFCPQSSKHILMLNECTLQSQYSYAGRIVFCHAVVGRSLFMFCNNHCKGKEIKM